MEVNDVLKNTKLDFLENMLSVELVKEGWATEVYIIIKAIEEEKNEYIENLFQVYEEDKMLIKEKINKKTTLVKVNYLEFINIIRNASKKDEIGSDKIDWRKINKIEIRLKKKINNVKESGIKEKIIKRLKNHGI